MEIGVSNPLISVIVPAYNVKAYLTKCITSIRNQSYKNIEIIIVDDGSTDGTAELCSQLQKKDARIKVLHKENGGAVSARKAGIVQAKGEYTLYVDGDDWIESNMICQMFNSLQGADVVIGGATREFGETIIYERNQVKSGVFEGEKLRELYKKMIYTGDFFERGILPYVCGKLIRTSILKRHQLQVPNQIRVGEDPACLYPMLLEAKKIVVMSECLYHYQIRGNSVMGVNDGKEMEKLKIFYSFLRKRFQNVKAEKEVFSQLDYLVLFFAMLRNIEMFQAERGVLFPYGKIKEGAKIAIYGAGRFGCELVRYLRNTNKYSLVLWVDNNVSEKVDTPESLNTIDIDYILVAVLMKQTRDEIERKLISMNIPSEKIKVVDIEAINWERERIEELLIHNREINDVINLERGCW